MSSLQASQPQLTTQNKSTAPARSAHNPSPLQGQTAAMIQRQVGNRQAGKFAPPNPNGSDSTTRRQTPDQFLAQRAALTGPHNGQHTGQNADKPGASVFFNTPAPVISSAIPAGQVQRRFSGELAKLTDSEIFEEIQKVHPEAPDRILRLIGAYRSAPKKRFDSITALLNSFDKSTWGKESQEEREQKNKDLEKKVEKFFKTVIREQKEAQRNQSTTNGAGGSSTGGDLDEEAQPYKLYESNPELFSKGQKQYDLDDEEKQKHFDGKRIISESTNTLGDVKPLVKPTFNLPKQDETVFSAVPPTLLVDFNGTKYDLVPGQNYLNVGVSTEYMSDKSAIKGNLITLGRPKRQDEEDVQKPVTVNDGHHRLMWSAFFHGETVRAEMKDTPALAFGGQKNTWDTMKYGDDPNKRPVQPPPLNELKPKLLREWVSPEAVFRVRQRAARGQTDPVLAFVKISCEFHKFFEVEESTQIEIGNYIAERAPHPFYADFDTVVATLVGSCKNKKAAKNIAESISSLKYPKNTKPSIIFDPTDSIGSYDTVLHVVTLDPVKNPNADALLDTLSFELQNSLQREPMRRAQAEKKPEVRAAKVANLEYDSDKLYVDSLIANFKAKDLNDLVVNKLQVPKRYLVKVTYEEVEQGNGKVKLPPREELPTQNKRESLWFWKTDGWSEEQKKQVWTQTEHAEGMGSSLKTY